MPSNLGKLQMAQYKVAEDLAREGRSGEAIDICWGLRLNPALILWVRAHVNLLLATELDVADHPDVAKFAIEAIDLSYEISRRVREYETKEEMKRFRRHARYTLEIVRENAANFDAAVEALEDATAVTEIADSMGKMHLEEHGTADSSHQDLTKAAHTDEALGLDNKTTATAKQPTESATKSDTEWQIEGIYTSAATKEALG